MSLITFKCEVGGATLFETSVERCQMDTVSGMKAGFAQVVDQEPAIDSAEMRLFGRGARSFTRGFVAERDHATVQDAATFHNEHGESIPAGVQTVKFTIGSSVKEYQGAVTKCEIKVDGTRTITDYELALVKT